MYMHFDPAGMWVWLRDLTVKMAERLENQGTKSGIRSDLSSTVLMSS